MRNYLVTFRNYPYATTNEYVVMDTIVSATDKKNALIVFNEKMQTGVIACIVCIELWGEKQEQGFY